MPNLSLICITFVMSLAPATTSAQYAADGPPESVRADPGKRNAASGGPDRAPASESDTRGVKIEEAHRTSPPNTSQGAEAPRPSAAGEASAGGSDARPTDADTRGVKIDEAHRTSPENTPPSTDGSPK